jgi:uncharacterized BrkB/YihY/UPF0761 family membrane protein
VVVLLVWVYYASLIVFFGAELAHVRSKRKDHRIRPTEHAVKTRPATG